MLTRPVLLLFVIAVATPKLYAMDSFVGKWKLNPEKSTMHTTR